MSISGFKQHVNDSSMVQKFTWMHNNFLLKEEKEEINVSNIDILPTQLRAEEVKRGHEFSLESKALAD